MRFILSTSSFYIYKTPPSSSPLRTTTAHIEFLPFHTLPLEPQRKQERQARAGDREDERRRDGQIVRGEHAGQLGGRRDLPDMCGAGANDGPRIDAGGVQGDLLDEGVGEDVLGDGDGDGAAERVEEDGDRVADWHVLLAQHDLHRDKGDLHARARAEARQDLVADPRCGRRVDFQRVQ